MRRLATLVLLAVPALLAGCDMLGIESTGAVAARRDAEGKAIGAGCRHSARSVEDCYDQNKRADKAALFAGWKEMNDYMRENKIESSPPQAESEPAVDRKAEAKAKADPAADAKADAKPAGKSVAKAGVKGADPGKH